MGTLRKFKAIIKYSKLSSLYSWKAQLFGRQLYLICFNFLSLHGYIMKGGRDWVKSGHYPQGRQGHSFYSNPLGASRQMLRLPFYYPRNCQDGFHQKVMCVYCNIIQFLWAVFLPMIKFKKKQTFSHYKKRLIETAMAITAKLRNQNS